MTRSATGPGLGRMVGSIILVLGIVLMHHVVFTTCGSAMSGQAHGHAIQMEPMAAPDVDASSTGAPLESAPAAALCLAVVLGGWLLAPIVRAWRIRSERAGSRQAMGSEHAQAPPRPLDRTLLSVCRT